MLERKGEALLSRPRFVVRVGKSLLMALGVVAVGLVIGTAGYHFVAALRWVDSFMNAAMILTGMGPVDLMRDTPSKLFAAGFAIFSGVVFLSSMGIVLTPVVHRVVHKFHLASEEEDK